MKFIRKSYKVINVNLFLVLFLAFFMFNMIALLKNNPKINETIKEKFSLENGYENKLKKLGIESYTMIVSMFTIPIYKDAIPNTLEYFKYDIHNKKEFILIFSIILLFIMFIGTVGYVKNFSIFNILKYLVIISLLSMLFTEIISKKIEMKRNEYFEKHKININNKYGYFNATDYMTRDTKIAIKQFFSSLFWIPIVTSMLIKSILLKKQVKPLKSK